MLFKTALLFEIALCLTHEARGFPMSHDQLKPSNEIGNASVHSHQISDKTMVSNIRSEQKEFVLALFFKANWYRALQYCRHGGMDLASFKNKAELDIVEYLIESVEFDLTSLWTAGTDSAEEGKFFWMSTGEPLTFTDWVVGQPDGGLQENCVALKNTGGLGYGWVDAPCSDAKYFICQYYPFVFSSSRISQFI